MVRVWQPAALFARGLCWLLSKSQLQALSQQAAQPCHSQQTPITRKVVAGGEEEALLPLQGEGRGGDALVAEVGLGPAWGAKRLPAKELGQWSSGSRVRTSDPSGGI